MLYMIKIKNVTSLFVGNFNVHFALIQKMATNTTAGQTLYRTLIEPFVCIFMVEETFIWTEIWKKHEALITFLKGQDVHHGS